MLRKILILCSVITAVACSQASDQVAAKREPDSARSAASQYMAYEHRVDIETATEQVAGIHDRVVNDCQQAVASHCVVLESSLRTGEYASSRVRLRATANGIAAIIASLDQDGEIISQTKTGEDLESAIVDNDKRLSMLKDYRSKLEALSARGNHDINALLQITKELTQVQSDIESLTGSHAHLLQRVETELLTIEIHSRYAKSFWRPIAHSFSDFGDDLSKSIATFVTALAYLLPWIALLTFVIWLVRKLWRKHRA